LYLNNWLIPVLTIECLPQKSNKKAKRAEEPATSKVDGPAWADPDDEGAIIDVTKQKRCV
jgi:hypothetical protein